MFKECSKAGKCSDKASCVKYWARQSAIRHGGACDEHEADEYIDEVYNCCSKDSDNPYN